MAGRVHQEYSIHLGDEGIYVEGGGEVLYIDRNNGNGMFIDDRGA